MNSLVCIGVPTTSGGQGARGQAGARGSSYNQLVFVGVPITSALKFWSAHHLSCNKADLGVRGGSLVTREVVALQNLSAEVMGTPTNTC